MSKKEDEAYSADETETPDQVFVNSESRVFNGAVLQPYSVARQWAADAMTLRYGHLDKAGMARWNKENTYPGFESDVGIILWLCSIPADIAKEKLDAARRDPISASEEAAEWAKSKNIHSSKTDEFWPAYAVFLKIMHEHHISTGTPQKKTEPVKQPKKAA